MGLIGVTGPGVLDTSTTTGTGTYTLAGAVTGYQSVGSVLSDGDTGFFMAEDVDTNGKPIGGWEEFYGTYTASGTLLARTKILKSSNSNNAVNWSSGTRRIALIALPANAQGINSISFAGVMLTGVAFIRAFGSNLSTGDTDIYTVPTGKRAIVGHPTAFNPSAGTIAFYTEVKISGTYYRLSVANSVTTGTGNVNINGGHIILDAGDILAVNTATTNGLNISFHVVEFDATSPLKSARVVGPSTGDNTVYTCPTGKTASILSAGGLLISFAQNNNSVLDGALNFVADGGGTRSVYVNNVPSGGSVGSTNKMIAATSVTANNRSTAISTNSTLAAGDFISFNVDTGNAAQIAWINVVEVGNR